MKVYSVIICYNPEIENLTKTCRSILSVNSNVVLVDNSEQCELHEFAKEQGVDLIFFNQNKGYSIAQNAGIKHALAKGAEVVAFFDQDSEIEKDFIQNLTQPIKDHQPIVVSPVFYDNEFGFRFPSYRLNKIGMLKPIEIPEGEECYDVDVVISSGSAATAKTFEVVGLMNEDYFIDFVDTEWSLRCKNKGVPIKVVSKAIMKHSIGSKSINLKIMRVFVHSPTRTYYKVRNAFLFIKNKNVPFLFGFKELISALLHNFLIVLFSKNKGSYFKNYFKAIWDGILGKKGKKK